MWTIAALVGSHLLKLFTFETVKYLALRAFLFALFLGLGPIVIFKGFSIIIQFLLDYAGSYITEQGLQPFTVNLVGVGAWIGSQMKVAEGLSVFLSFCLLSFTLKMIRVK